MSFLTSAELADMRAHLVATLPDTCAIYYATLSTDGAGRQSESWTPRGTAIACRLAPQGGREAITAEQVRAGMTWVLSVASSQTVDVKDKVVFGGRTYRVIHVNHSESELGLTRAILESGE